MRILQNKDVIIQKVKDYYIIIEKWCKNNPDKAIFTAVWAAYPFFGWKLITKNSLVMIAYPILYIWIMYELSKPKPKKNEIQGKSKKNNA